MTIARLEKVRAGFYRCGKFCIHRGHSMWGVYQGPLFVTSARTLYQVQKWVAQNQADEAESGDRSQSG